MDSYMLIFWPQSGWLRSCQLSNMSWNSTLYGWSFYWIQRDSCLSESSWWAPWTLTLRALSRSLCLSLCCLYETLMFDPAQGGDRSAVRCLQWSSKQSRQPPWWFIYQEWNRAHPFPPSVVQGPVSGYRPPPDQTYYGAGCACVWALIATERLQ